MSTPAKAKIGLPEWLSINPGAIVLIVAALVVGIFLGAEHGKLPESANIIVGPAVGSFLAVGAGAWLANWQERRRRTEAKIFLLPILDDISTSLEAAVNGYAPYEARLQQMSDDELPEDRVEAAMVMHSLDENSKKLKRRLEELRPAFGMMVLQGNLAFADAREILKRVDARISRHFESQADIVKEHTCETVGNLIDLKPWSRQLHPTTEAGRYIQPSSQLPESVRHDPRWK